MKQIAMCFAVVGLVAGQACAAIWYVDLSNQSGTEDGLTWASAFTTIQAAIDAAGMYDDVHVAQGVYGETRTVSIPYPVNPVVTGAVVMKPTVDLIGGFSGNGVDRNPVVFETVIDGSTSRGGNAAYHVVIGSSDARLDGFTLRGAKAALGGPGYSGGGVRGLLGGPHIVDCVFEDLQVPYAAVHTESGSQIIEGCTFNLPSGGSAVFSSDTDLTMMDCTVTGEVQAITTNGGSLRVEDCTFTYTGIHDRYGLWLVETDATIVDTALNGYGIIEYHDQQTTLLAEGLTCSDAELLIGATVFTFADSTFANCTIWGDTHGTWTDCTFEGTQVDGNSPVYEITGCEWLDSTSNLQGGSLEVNDCALTGSRVTVQWGSLALNGCELVAGEIEADGSQGAVMDCALDADSTIRATASRISVEECNISGGMVSAVDASAAQIEMCTFADGFGTTVSSLESAVGMYNCTIRRINSISGPIIEHEGGLPLVMLDCELTDNSSVSDGTVVVRDCEDLVVARSLFMRNVSGGPGGGLALIGVDGGSIVNTAFVGNSAREEGGGLYLSGSPVTIHNSVIWGNSAGIGAAGIDAFGSAFELRNSVLWKNSGMDIRTVGVAVPVVEYNDIQDGYSGDGNFSAIPLLRNPFAGDLRIRSDSPLIDAGTAVSDPTTDIQGVSRPQHAAYDLGLYEFQDTDGDGMEDAWELQYSLNPNDDSDADDDGDSDGYTNLEEFDLDTDPGTATTVPADYHVSPDGDDVEGEGTVNAPWRTISYAMNEAGLVAPYIGGATVHLAAGVYEEAVELQPNVTLAGDSAATTTIRYFNASDDDHVVVHGSEDSVLRDVKVTLPALHADVTVLVRIDNVATEIDSCILDGGDNLFSIGALVSGVGSSDGSIHDSTIRRVQYGIQAVNSAIDISDNTFEAIRGDAVFVELPAKRKQGEPVVTPQLGDAGDADSGFNTFTNVAGKFVLNLSGLETSAEQNDWGVYSQAQIAAKMAGDVDFMPFLGRDGTIPVGPDAALTATPTTGLTPLNVQFTDVSNPGSFDITSRAWNFGDPESGANNTSALKNPMHVYTQPGRYTVSLTVTTDAGESTIMMTDIVDVTAAEGPQASFSVTPGDGYAPLAVEFGDTSEPGTSTITRWEWDFGDPQSGANNTSTEQNPSHTYAQPGIYFVKLEIETSVGDDTAFRSAVVVLEPEGPAASFTADPLEGSAPLEVQFTDASVAGTSSIASWLWDFDDGTTSTEQNPLHTFADAGVYTVSLTVTTEHGTDEKTELAYITVSEAPACGAEGKLEYAAAGMFFIVFERVTRRRRKGHAVK